MRRKRGVTPIIATVLLLSLTMVLVSVLYYAVKVPMPPQAPYVGFSLQWNSTQLELIGQGDNAPGSGGQCPKSTGYVCYVRGMDAVVSEVGTPAPLISLIQVELACNSTIKLSASLASINYTNTLAASKGGTPPTPTIPVCGGHLTPNYKNGNLNCFGTVGNTVPLYNLVYYKPINSKAPFIEAGDQFIAYTGGFCISTSIDGSIGDDYYGPPPWCNTIPGACVIQLWYTGNPAAFIGSIPLDPQPS
ncbi:MAG: hypothetical protein KGI98_17600 [Euryarchaeota archaeon]|nr:hypothetical protein [Euryarchaeota archaeon]